MFHLQTFKLEKRKGYIRVKGRTMKVREFKRFLRQMNKLTKQEVKKLQKQLNQQNSLKVINSISVELEHCPHCGSLNFYKWGVRSKLQRYKCNIASLNILKTLNVLFIPPILLSQYIDNLEH